MDPFTLLLVFVAYKWLTAPKVQTQRFEDVPSDKKDLPADNRPGTHVTLADVDTAKGGSALVDIRTPVPANDGSILALLDYKVTTAPAPGQQDRNQSQVGAQKQLDDGKQTRTTFSVPSSPAFDRMGGATS